MSGTEGPLPIVIRVSLSALVFLVGGVKILQFLTPEKALAARPPSERERTEIRRPPPALVWGTAVTTLFIGTACLLPWTMLSLLEQVAAGLRWLIEALLGDAYGIPVPGDRGPLGPAPVTPPPWAIALAVVSVVLPGLLLLAWKAYASGRRTRSLLISGSLVAGMVVCSAVGSAIVEDLSGRTYRRALRQWVRRASPVPPGSVMGREGPVILYARPVLYREVEPGILYRRTMDVTERGEVVPSEQINEFTVGRLTVKARPGRDLVVSGVPSSYEGVIITQEPLRIGGYLFGGALEPRHGLQLYIAPADHREWREDLERLWGGTDIRQRAATTIYVAWFILACAWGLGVFANCLIRPAPPHVEPEKG